MIAVISDVHGNLPALSAVLQDIEAQGVTRIWCLGDTVGYGPFVNECLRLIAQRCEVILAGNHDLAVRGDIDAGLFGGSGAAVVGIEYARRAIAPDAAEVLVGLATNRIVGAVELYHASARDPVWEYVLDPQVATSHLLMQRHPLSLVGHSHRQVMFALPSDATPGAALATGGPAQAVGAPIALDPSLKFVANPGSVGQPRDGDPRAGYALIDGATITFVRVEYDLTPMHKAVEQVGLPASIAECLEVGSAPR